MSEEAVRPLGDDDRPAKVLAAEAPLAGTPRSALCSVGRVALLQAIRAAAGGREAVSLVSALRPLGVDEGPATPLADQLSIRHDSPATPAASAASAEASAATATIVAPATALGSRARLIDDDSATFDLTAVHGSDGIGRLLFRDVHKAEALVADEADCNRFVLRE